MTRTSLLLGTLAFTLTAPLVGCGGIEPGDYIVYRVATSSAKLSGDCANNDPDTKSDSTTLLGPGTWVLYAGVEDTFYLDIEGGSTLEGTAADDVYSFAGKATDIQFALPNGGGDKTTTTQTTTVEVTTDGAAVTGTYSDKTSIKCAGATCGGLDFSCTTTQSFVGTEVEDVELDYGL